MIMGIMETTCLKLTLNRMEADLIKKYGEGNYQVVRAADIQNEMNNILNSGKTPVDFSIDEYNRLKKLQR